MDDGDGDGTGGGIYGDGGKAKDGEDEEEDDGFALTGGLKFHTSADKAFKMAELREREKDREEREDARLANGNDAKRAKYR